MSSRNLGKTSKILIALSVIFLLTIVTVVLVARSIYYQNLEPVSSVSKQATFLVEQGTTTSEVAKKLKAESLIKSDWAFEWYVRMHKSTSIIQAGTYVIDQNQSVKDILAVLSQGKVATDLVTILPGRTLSQTKLELEKYGYTADEVDSALNPALYSAHPALVDKPADATLEGYLYPETFQRTASTKLEDIIRLSLDEMAKALSDNVKAGFKKQGLTVHQAITLASIVENESATADDRSKVASVFLNRLKEGRPLQSNATDEYAKNNPAYDTYKIPGLPPGPISNVSGSSLQSVANPADTDYLFFVTADDKKTTYFSKTVEEHNALVRQYCKENCAPH